MKNIVLYCRAGFENECAAEIVERAGALAIYGFVRQKPLTGYVVFCCYQAEEALALVKQLAVNQTIFIRQLFLAGELLAQLPVTDRITPIIEQLAQAGRAGELRVEVPDTNQGKELLTFCRKFTVPLRNALRQQKRLSLTDNNRLPTLHVFFIAANCCYVGYSFTTTHSPWFMGIMRLKFPHQAPSRSTLKLEEAFHFFIPADEWEERLTAGLHAVDLGAAPGGWTYQLVNRGMWVEAVDNGAMDQQLLASGQVRHYQQDGFKYQPKQANNYWLVCDMVENPAKVMALVVDWLVKGYCREAIVNWKLPMKQRYATVRQLEQLMVEQLQQQGINAQHAIRHLYHDREEVTLHVRRIWAWQPKNKTDH